MFVVIACVFILMAKPAVGVELSANFHMTGIKGSVTLSQATISGPVDIVINLTGLTPGQTYYLELHAQRVSYDVADRCSDSQIGPIAWNITSSNFTGLGSRITITSGMGTLKVQGIDLDGVKSVQGKSLAIVQSSNPIIRACATIEEDTDYVTAFANFPAYVGGTVFFRQKVNSPSSITTISGSLYYISDSSGAPTNYKWQINKDSVVMDMSQNVSITSRCSSTGVLFNQSGATSFTLCSTSDQRNCPIGDLTSKLGNLSIGTFSIVDLNLPLSGPNSIINRSITLSDASSGTIKACANVIEFKTKAALAKFSNEGVHGYIKFTQMSPLDETLVEVSLEGLNSSADGYHVHEWPVPRMLEQGQAVCNGEYVSGHFNPFFVNVSASPSAGTGTNDQYEIGDLSGKYGTLRNLIELKNNYTDRNLPLFGVNSVVGRSIVIHKAPTGARWVCATLEVQGDMTTAVATFTYPVIGHIILRQPKDDWFADTQVYVELNYGNSASQTIGHNWHIHIAQVGTDWGDANTTSRCQSVQGHYNPYYVDLSVAGNYTTQCNSRKQFRCEVGDLSGKHGSLSIRSSMGGMFRAFYTDVQLPLTGPQSILGRSITIHAANSGSGRLSCANVYELHELSAHVSLWFQGTNTGTPTGHIQFQNPMPGILAGITDVNVHLSNLISGAGGYHVHQFPTDVNAPSHCSDTDVGGHFNPFYVTVWPATATGTNDQYEIGDLSNKFGMLSGPQYMSMFSDTNLPLRGPLSIIGRSVVIHDKDGKRWACGNILEDTSNLPNTILFQGRAQFTGLLNGAIYLSQYLYPNGKLSDTMVLVDLSYSDGRPGTMNHNWHVHVYSVSGNCSTTGDHFNPFQVDVQNNYSECNMTNPLRCEVGDQSRKLGQYSIGSGRKFYVDVNLPLTGRFAVLGRSIVVHAENGGAPRIACADLMPYNSAYFYTIGFPSVSNFNRTDMAITVASAINTDTYNVVCEQSENWNPNCMTAKVHFLGSDALRLNTVFKDLISSGNYKELRIYSPDSSCKVSSGVTGKSRGVGVGMEKR
ncbi:hypothetical protein ACJMK2_005698 [Sinanodonta woodiana]|uniref:Superoxide dismutase copper/zinc binding domain-containing protein n=1 Tax=Sinanodonta woodiana TaxID=1069815 RepID=A0ABD3VS79_SINWO